MVQTYLIALGSNLGTDTANPQSTMQNAICALANSACMLRRVSRFFATPCFPAGAGPDYVNACISVSFDGPADALLRQLHSIEADFGRERVQRWGSRSLDLDLLAAGDQVLPSDELHAYWRALPAQQQTLRAPDQLILPHPRLQDRAFVLVPLCDIALNWRHPVLGQTVQEMTAALDANLRAEVVPL